MTGPARQIELPQEYCTRLIADVVTGQPDMREVAANLLDGIDEPESCDREDVLSDGGEDLGKGFGVALEITA